jgi:hypothetical protein
MVCSGGQPVNFTIMNVGELSAEAPKRSMCLSSSRQLVKQYVSNPRLRRILHEFGLQADASLMQSGTSCAFTPVLRKQANVMGL